MNKSISDTNRFRSKTWDLYSDFFGAQKTENKTKTLHIKIAYKCRITSSHWKISDSVNITEALSRSKKQLNPRRQCPLCDKGSYHCNITQKFKWLSIREAILWPCDNAWATYSGKLWEMVFTSAQITAYYNFIICLWLW